MLCTDVESFKIATLTGHHVTSIAAPMPAEATIAASRESSKQCADVSADIEKTRESLRGTIERLQATSEKSKDVMSATADFESKWAAFKAKFDEGITALIVDLEAEGIEVRPIRDIAGEELFCDVFFFFRSLEL